MTEEQEVLERTRRRRRRAPALLLGGLPVLVASTALAGAYSFVPATASYAQDASPVVEPVRAEPVASIHASGTAADASDLRRVTVTVPPPEPEPAPVAAPASSTTTVTGDDAPAAPATSSPAAAPTVSFTSYCANPQAPSSASSVSGLLAATNAERAKLGIAPLTWASDLASAATSWSQQMAAQDSGTSALADALTHNPGRPGAENVGVVYRSTGLAESSAMGKLHVNWVYSPGHCANLMNPAYTQMGAGAAVTEDGTTWYATENFR
ncbi:CAP domain-containing protein [Demequina sp. SYSU T00192]|uniref:CAP domain-containing protein n=1 Tax=Demequina litoralis TaxID=3051660 RepID=A0ABT8G8P0_9MICO|nr:CAP domain-containing protein [Demequina sp. SYSU T00192]MDN4475501.1 CAP domain-containing protein [Demequina sp. SYSU T00192]